MFDLLRGPHWALLTFDHGLPAPRGTIDSPLADTLRIVRITTDTTATGPGTVIDTGGRAHLVYDIDQDTSVLIRPDGYIAARVTVRHDDHALRQDGASASQPS